MKLEVGDLRLILVLDPENERVLLWKLFLQLLDLGAQALHMGQTQSCPGAVRDPIRENRRGRGRACRDPPSRRGLF